jgi:hypothetical protein
MSMPLRRWRARAHSPTGPDNPFMAKHQAFIRALPCVVCGKPARSECACVRFHPGFGLPLRDPYLLPLCGPETVWEDCCHSRKHFLGAARFWLGLGIDPLDLAARLWRVSGDVEVGEREIRLARQRRSASGCRRTGAGGNGNSSPSWGDPVGALRNSRSAAMPQAQACGQVASLLERV